MNTGGTNTLDFFGLFQIDTLYIILGLIVVFIVLLVLLIVICHSYSPAISALMAVSSISRDKMLENSTIKFSRRLA